MSRASLPRSPVVDLLRSSGPATIGGGVGPVVVAALDRQSGRRLAHVCEKVLEGEPALADDDATPSIVLPIGTFGIATPLDHRSPASVKRGLGASSGVAVPEISSCSGFLAVTAATDSSSTPQGIGASDETDAAIALAEPEQVLFTGFGCAFDGDKSPEAVSSDIFESGHDGSLSGLSCQVAARRFSGGPSRYSTIFCGGLQ